jgi:hypothetical protein
MPEPEAFVFGYASLVGLREQLRVREVEFAPLPGRLKGFRRSWGVAMDNWEAVADSKHFVDPETGERPRVRVAYLDIRVYEGSSVNGLAIPVDAARLAAFDEREVNYERIDVSGAFEPVIPQTVFAYLGTEAARERCRKGVAESNICISADYAAAVRHAFEQLAPDALAEFDRTTDPLSLPQRELAVIGDEW